MEEESSLRLVIFDLDGTLIKIPIDYPKMYLKLRRLFRLNLDVIPLRLIDELTRNKPALREKAFEIITEAEIEALPSLVVNPRVKEVCEGFKGLRKGLVTM